MRPTTLKFWVLVLALLVGVDVWLGTRFLPVQLAAIFEFPEQGLRDRTGGRNLGVVFWLAASRLARPRSVALVGDSTIVSPFEPDNLVLAPRVQRVLRFRVPDGPRPEVVELGFIGLPADEAVIVIAKALAMGTDLVVYGVTPRVICDLPQRTTNAVDYVTELDVLRQLGPAFVLESYPPGAIATSLARSRWLLLEFRSEIDWAIGLSLQRHVPEDLAPFVAPHWPTGAKADLGLRPGGPLWPRDRCSTDDAAVHVRALREIFSVCAASKRCLIYHSPLNPNGMANFDGTLAPDFAAVVARLVEEYRVPYLDLSNRLPADRFPLRMGRVDSIHPDAAGRAVLAGEIATKAAELMNAEDAGRAL